MLSKLLSATSYRFPRVLVLMVFGGSEGVWWWYKSLIMSQVADIRGSVQYTVIQVPVLILIMEGCLLRLLIKVLLVFFSLSLFPCLPVIPVLPANFELLQSRSTRFRFYTSRRNARVQAGNDSLTHTRTASVI